LKQASNVKDFLHEKTDIKFHFEIDFTHRDLTLKKVSSSEENSVILTANMCY